MNPNQKMLYFSNLARVDALNKIELIKMRQNSLNNDSKLKNTATSTVLYTKFLQNVFVFMFLVAFVEKQITFDWYYAILIVLVILMVGLRLAIAFIVYFTTMKFSQNVKLIPSQKDLHSRVVRKLLSTDISLITTKTSVATLLLAVCFVVLISK